MKNRLALTKKQFFSDGSILVATGLGISTDLKPFGERIGPLCSPHGTWSFPIERPFGFSSARPGSPSSGSYGPGREKTRFSHVLTTTSITPFRPQLTINAVILASLLAGDNRLQSPLNYPGRVTTPQARGHDILMPSDRLFSGSPSDSCFERRRWRSAVISCQRAGSRGVHGTGPALSRITA